MTLNHTNTRVIGSQLIAQLNSCYRHEADETCGVPHDKLVCDPTGYACTFGQEVFEALGLAAVGGRVQGSPLLRILGMEQQV